MKVGLNAEPLFQRVPTGVGVYTLALATALVATGHQDDLVLFHAAHPTIPDEVPAIGMRREAYRLERTELYRSWAENRAPSPETVCGPLDVVHAPGPAVPPPGSARLVATIHDLAPLRFPDRYPRQTRMVLKRGAQLAARDADIVICPSQHTAGEAEDLLGIGSDRIRVIPHGVSMPAIDADTARELIATRGIREPYVLWVGTQEERKNVQAVIGAFEATAADVPELSLVLHGPQGWLGGSVDERLRRNGLASRVVVSEGSLLRHELAALYTRSSAFVFPSLYEGFGLPVLEAMACGAPVITSDTSALPESAGDAAMLIDPFDGDALADALGIVMASDQKRAELSRRGRDRAAAFNWELTARRTWAAYSEAVSS
jgi:glycosyltransferase involved in cell wall biosynthesis